MLLRSRSELVSKFHILTHLAPSCLPLVVRVVVRYAHFLHHLEVRGHNDRLWSFVEPVEISVLPVPSLQHHVTSLAT